ncbi:MAG: SDR family NAD(P)-dependent oxidoreductase, partial [Kiritimatiellae bacterium]|nr:SDR family NAD(P)-dependent oxidoreductase [Kiritimatiellia bacterium]
MRFPPVEKKVLITGCSTGIGWAAAEQLRAQGWEVIPTARKAEDLERLRAAGFEPIALEMADEASVNAAADETLRRFGGAIGAVVNNAGYGQPGAVEDVTRGIARRQFEVNVFGLQQLTNRFIPVFRERGAGRIVNVSSIVGWLGLPLMGVYSASKFALRG